MPHMPQSVSLVGLARRGVIPQNNSTSICSFYDPVVLDGLAGVISPELGALRQQLRFRRLLVEETVMFKNKTAGLLMGAGWNTNDAVCTANAISRAW